MPDAIRRPRNVMTNTDKPPMEYSKTNNNNSTDGNNIINPPPLPPIVERKNKEAIRQKFRQRLMQKKIDTYKLAYEQALLREQTMCTKEVTISVEYNTYYGQNLGLVGSIPQLGCWVTEKALPMTWTEGNIWIVVLMLPAREVFDYKFVLNDSGRVVWEPGNNHKLSLKKVTEAKFRQEETWGRT